MWWIYPVAVVIIVIAVWGLISLSGFETRWLSRRTTRRAEDMYDEFGDSKPPRKSKHPRDDR